MSVSRCGYSCPSCLDWLLFVRLPSGLLALGVKLRGSVRVWFAHVVWMSFWAVVELCRKAFRFRSDIVRSAVFFRRCGIVLVVVEVDPFSLAVSCGVVCCFGDDAQLLVKFSFLFVVLFRSTRNVLTGKVPRITTVVRRVLFSFSFLSWVLCFGATDRLIV